MVVALSMALSLAVVIPATAEVLAQVRFAEPAAVEAAVSDAERLVFALPRVDEAPTIDGRLDEAVWQSGRAFLGEFRLGLSATPARHYRRAWAAYDDRHLYLGVRLEREPGTVLRAAVLEDGNPAIWKDDEVEVFIDPFNSGTEYHQLIVNSRAALYDATHCYAEVPDARAASPGATVLERMTDAKWDSGVVRAVHVEDQWWSVEMALPLASVGLDGAPAGHRLGLNLTSADWDTGEYTTLSPNDDWHDPRQFGVAVLGEPVVRVTGLDLSGVGLGRNLLRASVERLGGPEGRYDLSLEFRAPGQWMSKVASFEPRPEADGVAELPFTVTTEMGRWEADIAITDPTGAPVFATRRGGMMPGPMRVELGSSAALTGGPPIRVSARLGVGRLTARDLTLVAQLVDVTRGTTARQELGPAAGAELTAVVPLAGLAPGFYVLELLAERGDELVARGSDIFRLAGSPFESEAVQR
ncbi:MAG: sugar-binding protein [Armatimonadota bacterium]|jgi:hypothetical protein